MSTKPTQKNKKTGPIRRNKRGKKIKWEQRVVEVRRVSKVVKGGKKLSFRATVILGNEVNQVGVGVGKADEVSGAIKKAVHDARKNLIEIPVTKNKTIPHTVVGRTGASSVLIRPASAGTGVIAGSSIKIVLELGGIQNVLAKQLGSNNLLNNARAAILGLQGLKTAEQLSKEKELADLAATGYSIGLLI